MGRPSWLALTDDIDVGIGQQEPMPVAGLTLGHHCVAGLHVAQDQGSMLDSVFLVLGQLCAYSRWARGPGQSSEPC